MHRLRDAVEKARELLPKPHEVENRFPKLEQFKVGEGNSAGVHNIVKGPLKLIWELGEGEDMVAHIRGRVHAGDIVLITAGATAGLPDHFIPHFFSMDRKAAAVLNEKGGPTDHGALVTGMMDGVCLTNIGLSGLRHPDGSGVGEGEMVTVYGGDAEHTRGYVYAGTIGPDEFGYKEFRYNEKEVERMRASEHLWRTKVMLNGGFSEPFVSNPLLLRDSSGIGFFRTEFLWVKACEGMHPKAFIDSDRFKSKEEGKRVLKDRLKEEFRKVLDAAGGMNDDAKMVWFRTQDMWPPFLYCLTRGDRYEQPPTTSREFARRGSRLRRPEDMDVWGLEAVALLELAEGEEGRKGYKNIGLFPPMIASFDDYKWWYTMYMKTLGLRGLVKPGVMVEVPGGVEALESICSYVQGEVPWDKTLPLEKRRRRSDTLELGGVIVGSNDLSQYSTATSRAEQDEWGRLNIYGDPVAKMIDRIIEIAHRMRVPVGIGGRAASDPRILKRFPGFDFVSVTPDPETLQIMSQAAYEKAKKEKPLLIQ